MKKIIFIALLFVIKHIDAQIINTIAGGSTSGYMGDGGLATAAELTRPYGLAIDTSGNIYFSDAGNNCIRKIDALTNIITTIAGNGTQGYSGDGALATNAQLYNPAGLAFDSKGNLIFADAYNNRIRKINLTTGIISTIAGIGTLGFSGDGGAATSAQFYWPFAVALDTSGNLFLPDVNNHRIRRVDAITGIITTIVGTGVQGYTGDGGQATAAELNAPNDIALDRFGNIFFTQGGGSCIRKVTISTGIITTIAGNGTLGSGGDGGLATAAQLNRPSCVLVDTTGNIFIADYWNNKIRQIAFNTGIITTIAGTGVSGYNGDGVICQLAEMSHPAMIIFNRVGNLFFTDRDNNRVREIVFNNHTTSINKENGDNLLKVYPSPSSGSFTLETNASPEQKLQIYDVNGRLVLTQTISGKTIIDSSSLIDGVYNINIISNERIIKEKLVILK